MLCCAQVHGSVTAPSIVINEQVDLVSAENGGLAIGWSDSHYGHPRQLINPGRGVCNTRFWLF